MYLLVGHHWNHQGSHMNDSEVIPQAINQGLKNYPLVGPTDGLFNWILKQCTFWLENHWNHQMNHMKDSEVKIVNKIGVLSAWRLMV